MFLMSLGLVDKILRLLVNKLAQTDILLKSYGTFSTQECDFVLKYHNFLTECLFDLIFSPKVLEFCPPALETLKTAHSSTLIVDLL